jgi:hypothetical protein
MRVFCPQCHHTVPTHVESRPVTHTVRGEAITVTARVRVCVRCDAPVFDRDLDADALHQAHVAYCNQHCIPLPPCWADS